MYRLAVIVYRAYICSAGRTRFTGANSQLPTTAVFPTIDGNSYFCRRCALIDVGRRAVLDGEQVVSFRQGPENDGLIAISHSNEVFHRAQGDGIPEAAALPG